jgi:KaiC/GvpD/RAD55 family RecA-like ATPase
LVERVKSGINGLDDAIEGGFPRGSLIVLAGEPGTGKTVFSMQFLVKGVELNESGVYVSFAEAKNTLINNFSRHLNVDLAKLEVEGKIKILDFTAIKEEALPIILESILAEVKALNAKRLVIDSFSALAQAFKEPIDVRIIVQTILSRIVREMDCTTIMVEEVPIGRAEIGLGMEEFVADGVLRLRAGELDKRLFRDLEIVKLRGTRLSERKLAFTLEGGFKAFTPFKLKPIEKPSRFQPIPDPPGKYSTGIKDLDSILEGGLLKGSTMLLELDNKVSMAEYHLIIVPIILNFMMKGRAVLLIPTIGVDAEVARGIGLRYGLTNEEINRFLRVCEAHPISGASDKPYIVVFDVKDPWKDYSKYLEIEKELMQMTGQPVMHVAGADSLASYYDESICKNLLGQDAIWIRKQGSLGILILKPGYTKLKTSLSSIASVHLRLLREHGCLLLYGVKPRTGLYGVEMDVSRGYPLPKLTPII